jgi:hypothetical protein
MLQPLDTRRPFYIIKPTDAFTKAYSEDDPENPYWRIPITQRGTVVAIGLAKDWKDFQNLLIEKIGHDFDDSYILLDTNREDYNELIKIVDETTAVTIGL